MKGTERKDKENRSGERKASRKTEKNENGEAK
jgi:hypothetical protein